MTLDSMSAWVDRTAKTSNPALIEAGLRDATSSVFHQRHLDGCCDHRAILADEELHRHAVDNLDQADALLFGLVTYEMMEAAFRPPAQTGARPGYPGIST